MNISRRACIINAGKFCPDKHFDGFAGVDDFRDVFSVLVFYNDDDEAIGYAISGKEGRFTVENCSPGDVDSDLIRAALPDFLKGHWNSVLLASTDIEEIEEEGVEHILLYPHDEPDDAARPFKIGDEFSSFGEMQKILAVHKVFGNFKFSHRVEKGFQIEQFLAGELDEPVNIQWLELGDIEYYDSETETLCLLYID